mgnify:CR=1 FL=1
MHGSQVSDALAKQAREVCRHLLPEGQEIKGEWAAPNVSGRSKTGKKTTSLRVALDGNRAGLWIDHADPSQKGDLISLWKATKNCDTATAFREAKAFLGIVDPGPKIKSAREGLLPRREPKQTDPVSLPAALADGSQVYKWLTETRKLDPSSLNAYGVGESRDGKQVAWPFTDEEGELRLVKLLSADDKKDIKVFPGGAPKLLFGRKAIPPDAEDLFITEGEVDAITLHGWGFPAVSVPFGTSKESIDNEWLQNHYEWLQQFKTIYLAGDTDEAGIKSQMELARRLGRDRCRLVTWPEGFKDANAWAQDGADGSDFYEGPFQSAQDMDPSNLKNAAHFENRVWECFFPPDGVEPGDPTPWTMPFRFRAGEVSTWTGYSKHGKTVLLNYILVYLAHLGRKSCVCSLEMKPEKNLQNMMRMAMGKNKPADENEFRHALGWMSDYFWIYDKVGTASASEILEVFAYAARKYGITHFVIDSLMRCSVHEEDNQGQKEFLNSLVNFAQEHDVHVHLVAHSKKPSEKRPEVKYWPTKHDVRGSVHITDLSHNVLCVWRNKKKEQELHTLEQACASENDKREVEELYDAMFLVLAQRGGDGDEPSKRLWFGHKDGSWQYRENRMATPRIFIPTKDD